MKGAGQQHFAFGPARTTDPADAPGFFMADLHVACPSIPLVSRDAWPLAWSRLPRLATVSAGVSGQHGGGHFGKAGAAFALGNVARQVRQPGHEAGDVGNAD